MSLPGLRQNREYFDIDKPIPIIGKYIIFSISESDLPFVERWIVKFIQARPLTTNLKVLLRPYILYNPIGVNFVCCDRNHIHRLQHNEWWNNKTVVHNAQDIKENSNGN